MDRAGQDIDGIEATAVCRARLWKDVYGRYLSVSSNFANLKPYTEIMQRGVCVGVLYTNDSFPYLL